MVGVGPTRRSELSRGGPSRRESGVGPRRLMGEPASARARGFPLLFAREGIREAVQGSGEVAGRKRRVAGSVFWRREVVPEGSDLPQATQAGRWWLWVGPLAGRFASGASPSRLGSRRIRARRSNVITPSRRHQRSPSHIGAQKRCARRSERIAAHAHIRQPNLRGKKASEESDQAKPSI